MSLELYNFPASTCSLKVRICLAEKKLKWIDHSFKPSENKHLTPKYLKLNPNGVVPTLVHAGNPIVDSSVILEYLEEKFPEPRLTPSQTLEVAHMRSWLRYFEEKATPAVRFPTFNRILIRNYENLTDEEFEHEAQIRPLKTDFYRKMGKDGFSDDEIKKAVHDFTQTIDRMENELLDGRDWLLGGLYTLADICVAPLIDRMEDLGYAHIWENRCPNVTRWFRQIKARPAYEKAYYLGSRYSEVFSEIGLGRQP